MFAQPALISNPEYRLERDLAPIRKDPERRLNASENLKLYGWPPKNLRSESGESIPSKTKSKDMYTSHMGAILSILPKNKQRKLQKSLIKEAKKAGISQKLFAEHTCLIEGISVSMTQDLHDFILQQIKQWKQSKSLRHRYKKMGGDLSKYGSDTQSTWFGEKHIYTVSDSCKYQFVSETLTKAEIIELDKKITTWEKQFVSVQKIKRSAKKRGIDSSEWNLPYELEKWTEILNTTKRLQQRANNYLKRAQKMYIDIDSSKTEEEELHHHRKG